MVGVAILSRSPVPGRVKTHLIPELGGAGAAALQIWLTRRIVATAIAARIGPITLWCEPDASHPSFRDITKSGLVALSNQPDGDLGLRITAALTGVADRDGALVVGTDSPMLACNHLRHAAQRLRTGDDAVMYPAEDGGYVLFALRRVQAALFTDIAWSTRIVADQTRKRFEQLRWRWSEPEVLWGVEHPEDWQRLLVEGDTLELSPIGPSTGTAPK